MRTAPRTPRYEHLTPNKLSLSLISWLGRTLAQRRMWAGKTAARLHLVPAAHSRPPLLPQRRYLQTSFHRYSLPPFKACHRAAPWTPPLWTFQIKLSLPPSITSMHACTHTYSHTHSPSLTHTHTLPPSLPLIHSLPLTHTYTLPLAQSTGSLSLSLTYLLSLVIGSQ